MPPLLTPKLDKHVVQSFHIFSCIESVLTFHFLLTHVIPCHIPRTSMKFVPWSYITWSCLIAIHIPRKISSIQRRIPREIGVGGLSVTNNLLFTYQIKVWTFEWEISSHSQASVPRGYEALLGVSAAPVGEQRLPVGSDTKVLQATSSM